MRPWQRAEYLIRAKKCIDSMLYIRKYMSQLIFIGLGDRLHLMFLGFYIDCCIVLEDSFPGAKKQICQNSIIDKIFHERDKHYAHDDKSYKADSIADLDKLIGLLKEQLEEVKKVCKDALPSVLTLDYVPHDIEYFRYINNISVEMDQKIREEKKCDFLHKNTSEEECVDFPRLKIELTLMPCINKYERIQRLQDACIISNICTDENMWVKPVPDFVERLEYLRGKQIIDCLDRPIEAHLPNGDILQYKKLLDLLQRLELCQN